MTSDCFECGAPCEVQGGHWCDGVDFDGSDVRFWLANYLCAAGHRYHLVDEAKTVKL